MNTKPNGLFSRVALITLYSKRLIYPDGESQELSHDLRINQLVDLNGNPLSVPLPTAKMIVYRVFRMTTQSPIGEEITCYHLELIRSDELAQISENA